MTTINEKIIQLRKSVGWSQAEMSRQIDITSAALSLIEKGDRTPSLPTCVRIAKLFDLSITELFDATNFSTRNESDEIKQFFSKFCVIRKLSERDQSTILSLAHRFLKDSKEVINGKS